MIGSDTFWLIADLKVFILSLKNYLIAAETERTALVLEEKQILENLSNSPENHPKERMKHKIPHR